MNVLIIDDDADWRDALKTEFEKRNCHVFEANDGATGLATLQQHSFNLVVSDIQMPILDGVGFLKAARTRYPGLPIYLMTGYSQYSEEEVLALGATGYFEKLDIDVEQILSQSRQP